MAARPGLDPRRLAPLFLLTALAHAASIISRFDEVARTLSPELTSGILLGTIALLFVEGYFEGRLDYGPTLAELPLWMRIKSGPVKASFTFAFTYLAIVTLQTWNIEIGPIDPTPPPEWSLVQRAQWFGMFTFGMFFVNFLAATSLLIPFFRAITLPLRWLPGVVGVTISSLAGVAAGYGATSLVSSMMVKDELVAAQDAWAQLTAPPAIAVAIALAITLVPILVGLVLDARKSE